MPSTSLLTLYYALIYPYLIYCNLIWASTYVTNLQRIYLLQKRAVRAISKADYKASSKPLSANLKILDVFSIYSLQVSSFMYLYHNDALPISFTQSFKLETRFINIQQDTLTLEQIIIIKFSILFQGPRIWNSLPNDIKNAPSFTPFAVHCGKIRIHLRQSSVNKTNIHSFARSGNHLRETYTHL